MTKLNLKIYREMLRRLNSKTTLSAKRPTWRLTTLSQTARATSMSSTSSWKKASLRSVLKNWPVPWSTPLSQSTSNETPRKTGMQTIKPRWLISCNAASSTCTGSTSKHLLLAMMTSMKAYSNSSRLETSIKSSCTWERMTCSKSCKPLSKRASDLRYMLQPSLDTSILWSFS